MAALLSLGISDAPAILLRATILLAAAVLLAWGLRRGSAGTRHLLWSTTFAALLCLPLAMQLLPSWELAILPPVLEGASASAGLDASGQTAAPGPVSEPLVETHEGGELVARSVTRVETRGARLSAGQLLAGVWLLGTLAALGSVAVGAWRLRRLVREARPVDDPEWLANLGRLRHRLGVGRAVRLLISPAALTPMTSGWRRPVVLLPAAALGWSAARREVVLAHELVHVRRRDAPRQLLCHAALSLYWFHPLSWLASKLAIATREQACDEAVLELGTRPSEYATHLLAG